MLRNYVGALDPADGEPASVGVLVFATPRTRTYFGGLIKDKQLGDKFNFIDLVEGDEFEQSRYLAAMKDRQLRTFRPVPELLIAAKHSPAQELSSYRRAYYAAFLDPRHLEAEGAGDKLGRLAIDILTVMAHIGQPVEADVLFLAPRIQRRLHKLPGDGKNKRQKFGQVLEWLHERELIVLLVPFQESAAAMPRYGLHATLLSEIWERSGVPLSEAVLSTAFNMSLYTAQPTDGPLPEPFLHDELGQLIDWMIGSYKDEPYDPRMPRSEDRPRVRPDAIAALRAALAIIRGFYSTTTLLALEGKDRVISPERDGALTEHAERLERLLAGFRACVGELDALADRKGQTGPFYPDEIVWLYNEIGVVKLAQGDLYEARLRWTKRTATIANTSNSPTAVTTGVGSCSTRSLSTSSAPSSRRRKVAFCRSRSKSAILR